MKISPLFPLAAAFALFACSWSCHSPAQVGTGNADSTAAAPAGTRRIAVNKTQTCGGIELTVGEILLEAGKVTVGLTAINRAPDVLGFYPDQKNIVVGTRQLDANPFLGEGKLSGEIQPNVEKRGSIVYVAADSAYAAPNSGRLDFHFGDVINLKTFKSTPCDAAAEIK